MPIPGKKGGATKGEKSISARKGKREYLEFKDARRKERTCVLQVNFQKRNQLTFHLGVPILIVFALKCVTKFDIIFSNNF